MSIKKLLSFLFCFCLFTSTAALACKTPRTQGVKNKNLTTASLTKTPVQWDKKSHQFIIGKARIKIGLDMVCGYYNNQALYASFGLEQQVFKCSKIIIPVALTYDHFFGRVEFAPLYDSIKSVTPGEPPLIYRKDSAGRDIRGDNPYFDWYKNLGTRLYYLGDFPIVQAYAGYRFNQHHSIIVGRIINHVGLSSHDTPWGDDGVFSPLGYWLTRDLLSGVAYQFNSQYVGARAAILSGNNPMKGYADYLNHIQSPNIKANNTPSVGLNADLKFGHWLDAGNESKLSLGMLMNTMGSTWHPDLKDGKRRNTVYAAGVLFNWPIHDDLSLDVFAQYTRYLSGLQTNSSQYDPMDRIFKNITQNGYFVGLTLHYKALSLSYTHEVFDRFDANVYERFVKDHEGDTDPVFNAALIPFENMRQSSEIVNLAYQINRWAAIQVNFQHINNPLQWVSDIIDTHPDYRVGVALDVKIFE